MSKLKTSEKLISTNPAKNYEAIGSVNISTLVEIKQKVTLAQKAKSSWKEMGVSKRIKYLQKLYAEFIKRKKEIANLITKEIGKPITETLDDLEWDQSYFKWFLDNGEKYLSDEITFRNDNQIHKIIFELIKSKHFELLPKLRQEQ